MIISQGRLYDYRPRKTKNMIGFRQCRSPTSTAGQEPSEIQSCTVGMYASTKTKMHGSAIRDSHLYDTVVTRECGGPRS